MVAIKAHEADRALAARDPKIAVYLFYGPDQGLVSERAESVAKASVTDPADPFQLIKLDAAVLSSDPLRLVDEANTMGLFGARRSLWVVVGQRFPVSALELLLANPPADTTLVLEAGDLARTSPLRLVVERARIGMAVPCYGDEARGLDAVIDAVMQEHGISIGRDARELLATRIGVDRRVSRREVEKLAIYVGVDGRAERHHIEAIVGDASARDVDDIVDGVFSGAIGDIDQAFERLSTAGEDPGVLLGFVARHAQALLGARSGIDSGKTSITDAVSGMRGVPYPRRRAIETALGRWSSPQLVRAIRQLNAAIAQVRFNPGLSGELATRCMWNLALSGGRG